MLHTMLLGKEHCSLDHVQRDSDHTPAGDSMFHRVIAIITLVFALSACAGLKKENACLKQRLHTMPRVSADVATLSFWTKRLGKEADAVLLSQVDIQALNKANQMRPWAFQDVTSTHIVNAQRIEQELKERRDWLHERLDSERYVEAVPGLMERAIQVIDAAKSVDELRVLHERADLRCLPSLQRLFAPNATPEFDRNQCSGLTASHLVRVLKRSGPWSYIHGAHSVGWVHEPKWSRPLSAAEARQFRDTTPRLVITSRSEASRSETRHDLGESYPLKAVPPGNQELTHAMPSISGPASRVKMVGAGVERGWLPFTRRNVLRLAFSELGQGYGWGETNGLTDCSRLLLDTFRPFGIQLGRHSSEQARSGTSTIDLKGLQPSQKRKVVRDGSRKGIVFLYMPGHIMLYLGEYEGKDYALSAIHSFRIRCDDGSGDTDARLAKVAVSDLLVGLGTGKGSFLDRLERIAVFGKNSGL